MNERYYKTGFMPCSIPPGRVLAHNRARHTIDTPYGLDGFRCWTWLKPDVPSDFTPCDCGWAGLPHLSAPNNRRT